MHVLDLKLDTLYAIELSSNELKDIEVLAASENYVAVGDGEGHVTVFNHNGNRVLVSYFF